MDLAYRFSSRSQGIDHSLFDQLLVSALVLEAGMFALTRRRGTAPQSVLLAGLVFEVSCEHTGEH